mmetsp:Transcript_19452/g.35262  ORF Transcript_19452/g.35262 Transcript_19452/m.35262 type:complete len:171 (+) Transcript_19452:61-573(+)
MGDWWGGVNRALRISHVKRKETPSAVHVLPDWVQENARLAYVSRSNGETHHVLVKKIEQRHKMVLIVFEQDKKIWKRVPFKDITLLGDGALKPLWKQNAVTATVQSKPSDYVAISDEEQEEAGEEPGEEAGPALPPPEEAASPKGAGSEEPSSPPAQKESRRRSRSRRKR